MNSRSYRMKQASSLSTDKSFQSISTPINTNSWGQLTFKDTNVFEEERKAYEEAEKVDFESLDSNNSRTITTTKSSGSEIFFINTGIRPYEQFSSSFCAAHACCFLYTYIMAVGVNRNLNEMSWWQYANSPDAPPLAKYIIKVLEEARMNVKNEGINYSETFATNYNETHDLNIVIFNLSNGRGLKYMEESIFNHNFTMWSAYYIPRGYDPIDNINVFDAEKPYIRNGTFIPNVLVAMKNLGCVSVPASNNYNRSPYVFDSLFEIDGTRRNSDEFFIKITNDAFDSKVIFPNFPNTNPISINNVENTNSYCNSIIKNISKHARSTWEYQENNNFKLITIKNNAATFLRTLRSGYPIVFDMLIINYKLDGERIPFIQENGLNYVMRYTNINQKRSDIDLECHAVVAVGFYLIGGQLKYVRVRNSWGVKWGDNGHFWMPMSYIEDRMPDGKSYCTSFYTIALKTDIFPEIRKLEFKVPEIKIDLLDSQITKINLIDIMTNANISIESINLNDLRYKIEPIPNKPFNVDYYKDSNNNSFLFIRPSPGGCKLTIFYLKNNIYIDTSVNLFWNLNIPEVFFTLINSVPPIPMSTDTRLILSPKIKGVIPYYYSFNLLPPSLSNSVEKSYFYLYRSIIRNSSKFTFDIINNPSKQATLSNNIITIYNQKPGFCTLITECEDDSSKITLTTRISWDIIPWGSTSWSFTPNLYVTIKETIVKINSK